MSEQNMLSIEERWAMDQEDDFVPGQCRPHDEWRIIDAVRPIFGREDAEAAAFFAKKGDAVKEVADYLETHDDWKNDDMLMAKIVDDIAGLTDPDDFE